ncbi:hypothetical protein ACFXTO_000738 [Malus domestica]
MPHISHTSHSPQALELVIPAGPVARAWPVPRACIRWSPIPRPSGPFSSPVPRATSNAGLALRKTHFYYIDIPSD